MGLGIHVCAPIARTGQLRRHVSRDAFFHAVEAAIDAYESDALARRFLRFNRFEHTLAVTLAPNAEPVEFTWQPVQSIVASAKSSTAGPGYHAYLVDLVRYIGSARLTAADTSSRTERPRP